jgi:hypothetical protein
MLYIYNIERLLPQLLFELLSRKERESMSMTLKFDADDMYDDLRYQTEGKVV